MQKRIIGTIGLGILTAGMSYGQTSSSNLNKQD
jgi:hypothetical protein